MTAVGVSMHHIAASMCSFLLHTHTMRLVFAYAEPFSDRFLHQCLSESLRGPLSLISLWHSLDAATCK